MADNQPNPIPRTEEKAWDIKGQIESLSAFDLAGDLGEKASAVISQLESKKNTRLMSRIPFGVHVFGDAKYCVLPGVFQQELAFAEVYILFTKLAEVKYFVGASQSYKIPSENYLNGFLAGMRGWKELTLFRPSNKFTRSATDMGYMDARCIQILALIKRLNILPAVHSNRFITVTNGTDIKTSGLIQRMDSEFGEVSDALLKTCEHFSLLCLDESEKKTLVAKILPNFLEKLSEYSRKYFSTKIVTTIKKKTVTVYKLPGKPGSSPLLTQSENQLVSQTWTHNFKGSLSNEKYLKLLTNGDLSAVNRELAQEYMMKRNFLAAYSSATTRRLEELRRVLKKPELHKADFRLESERKALLQRYGSENDLLTIALKIAPFSIVQTRKNSDGIDDFIWSRIKVLGSTGGVAEYSAIRTEQKVPDSWEDSDIDTNEIIISQKAEVKTATRPPPETKSQKVVSKTPGVPKRIKNTKVKAISEEHYVYFRTYLKWALGRETTLVPKNLELAVNEFLELPDDVKQYLNSTEQDWDIREYDSLKQQLKRAVSYVIEKTNAIAHGVSMIAPTH
jgi:hypothetical protein